MLVVYSAGFACSANRRTNYGGITDVTGNDPDCYEYDSHQVEESSRIPNGLKDEDSAFNRR